MPRTPRFLLAVAGTLAATVLAGPASAAGPPPSWCPPGADCGTVPVPSDRADPAAGTMAIAYARFPRTDRRRPSSGVVMPNPGGPGVSTIASADLYLGVLAPLRRHRDLLLIDVRGTGRSGAITCAPLAAADPFAVTFAQLGTLCGGALGDRARLFSTPAAADDLDAVREALGYRRVDAWGDSYGTFLMTVYAARHPEHVRSIVLDGAFPVDADPWGRDVLAGTRRALRLVCSRSSGRCEGDVLLRRIARLARELRVRPRPFTVRVPDAEHGRRGRAVRLALDEPALAAVTFAGGDPSGYAQLPAAVSDALRGRDARLRTLVAAARLGDAGSVGVDPRRFSIGAATAFQCHDYRRPYDLAAPPEVRRAQYAAAKAALPAGTFAPFSADAWLSTNIDAGPKCLEWPALAAPRSGLTGLRLPDVPVLVQSGDLDTNTPVEQGRAAAAQFPRAQLAVSANAGHTPDLQPCGAQQAIRFVERLHADVRACERSGRAPRVLRTGR
ncbi:MAG: alpha/beta fold hydrolase [Patulibacter minatonensis]